MGQKTIAEFSGAHDQIIARSSERMKGVPGREAEPVMTTATRPVIYIDDVRKLIETDTVAASPTLEHLIDQPSVVELGAESGVHQTAQGHMVTLGSPGAILDTEELDDNVDVDGNAEPITQQMARNRAAHDDISIPNLTATEKRLVSLYY